MVSHAKSQLYNIENCSADIYYYGVVVNANVVTYICMMHNCCFISVHNIVMSWSEERVEIANKSIDDVMLRGTIV